MLPFRDGTHPSLRLVTYIIHENPALVNGVFHVFRRAAPNLTLTVLTAYKFGFVGERGERGTLGGNFLKEVPSKPPSRTFKHIYIMNATIRTAFKLQFVELFDGAEQGDAG